MAFNTDISGDDVNAQLTLMGFLNESVTFPQMRATQTLTVDFHAVTFMNSSGILVWLRWIRLYANTPKILLINCPSVVITMINTVRDFLPPNGRVKSFFVPYSNEDGDEFKELIELPDGPFDESLVPAEIKLNGVTYEIDVNPKSYLSFLRK